MSSLKRCPVCQRAWRGNLGVHPDDVRVTPRQVEIIRFVLAFQAKHLSSPTYTEIGEHLGISKVTVFEHIHELIARNMVSTDRHKARSIWVHHPERFAALNEKGVSNARPVTTA